MLTRLVVDLFEVAGKLATCGVVEANCGGNH